MVKKEYRLRPEIPAESRKIFSSLPSLIQKILYYRGVDTPLKFQDFTNLDYEALHDPFLLPDMERAVERILEAVSSGEKIVVYSDYDADGIPGGVMLRDFFEKIGHKDIHNYIPHRHDEGYGVNVAAIEEFKRDGVKLIITVDCGISDFESVEAANHSGIDVIVTDHHESNGRIPNALAVINPKRDDSIYPDRNLCGSAVAFKLIQAILRKSRFGMKEGQEKWFLDLVGIATLSDMVPLTGENRILGYYGLQVLRKSRRPGLSKFWSKLSIRQSLLTEDDITFTLAPRINAASRMGEPQDAFRLLATKDLSEADIVSTHLNKINDERKGVVASVVKEIKKNLRERELAGALGSVIVAGNPLWKPSLLGLAANSIVEEFHRPVFLWGRNGDDSIKGSCRSDGSTDMVALMRGAGESFAQFGGHKMAGGFSVSHESVHFLEEKLCSVFANLSEQSAQEQRAQSAVGWVDANLSLDDLEDTHFHISKLAPFGIGNEKPVFMFEGVSPKEVRQFGRDKTHLEISFANGSGGVKAISFFSTPEKFSNPPETNKKMNLIANLEKSYFRDRPELRLRVVDIV